MNKFEITAGQSTSSTEIKLNGEPLKGVTKVSFCAKGNDATFLTLEILGEVRIEGGFEDKDILNIAIPANKDFRK